MTEEAGSLKLVPAVMRAAQILDQVAKSAQEGGKGSADGLKLSDLARRTGLPKSSVHGLCQTLVHLKLLKLNGDGSFTMGSQSVRWANVFMAGSDIVDAFHEAVAEAEGLGAHTLTLSHLEGPEVIYLSCRNSTAPLGITFRIGMRVPAVFTATGKAMLGNRLVLPGISSVGTDEIGSRRHVDPKAVPRRADLHQQDTAVGVLSQPGGYDAARGARPDHDVVELPPRIRRHRIAPGRFQVETKFYML